MREIKTLCKTCKMRQVSLAHTQSVTLGDDGQRMNHDSMRTHTMMKATMALVLTVLFIVK